MLVAEQDAQSVVEAEQSSDLHLKDNNKVYTVTSGFTNILSTHVRCKNYCILESFNTLA